MSYSAGENTGQLPYPQSRTGSISSYNPSPTTATSMSYFADQQQRSQAGQSSTYNPQHHLSWQPPARSQPAGPSTLSAPSSAPASSSSSHTAAPLQAQPAPSSVANSIMLDSPGESRSDTDDHAAPENGSAGKSKRKSTEEPDSARSKKKRNRAVLSCAPCKSRKVGIEACIHTAHD